MKEIEEFLKYSNLFATYKEMFSGKQKEYLVAFLEEDNSFSEIAEAMNVSRQAVFENIKKGCKKLEFYEERLNVLEKNEKYLMKLKKLKENFDEKILDEIIDEIEGS